MPLQPNLVNRTDGNGLTRSFLQVEGLICAPNGVEVWATNSAGIPSITGMTLTTPTIANPTITGQQLNANGTASAPSIAFASDSQTGMYLHATNHLAFTAGTLPQLLLYQNGARLRSDSVFGWSSTVAPTGSADLILLRDAANTLAQRNGTNAQAFRVYSTYANSGTDYERVTLSATAGSSFALTAEKGGTGSARGLNLGTASTGTLGLFTNNTVRWNIDGSTGHLLASADNTYDIGASGATRPRTVYTGTSIFIESASTGLVLGTSGARASIIGTADGVIQLSDNAGTSFGRLCIGGTTSSFPSLKRNGSGIIVRAADDSANVACEALQFYATSNIALADGVAAPSATAGQAKLYVDTADGDLKVIFGDGTIKTIVVDT